MKRIHPSKASINPENILKSALTLCILFFLIGYILLPLLHTFETAFKQEDGYSIKVFLEYFTNPNQVRAFLNTIQLGVLTVIVCGITGTFFAFCMTFLKIRYKKVIHILLLCPMMIPGVIIVIAFNQLYGESGIVTKGLQLIFALNDLPYHFQGLGAILFVIAYTQYVYFYLNVHIALKYLDQSAIDAAKGMGAGPLRIFKDIIWPVIRPAFLSSSMISFASGISAFSAPNLIGGGYKVLSTQIVRSKANNYMNVASAEVLLLLILSLTAMLLISSYEKRYPVVYSYRPSPLRKESLSKSGQFIGKLLLGIQIILVILPILAITYLSFISTKNIMRMIFPYGFTLDNYREIFHNKRTLKPILNSLKMSAIAVAMGLSLSIPASILILKFKSKLSIIIKWLILLPWCMPASVIAINLINAFIKPNFFSFGKALIGGYMILPIAYTIASLPLLVNSCQIAIQSQNPELELASRTLGAGPLKTFLHIILPACSPGIFSGATLMLIRTIGEYTMSALLYGVYNRPVSISMIVNMQEFAIGISYAFGVMTILICSFALWLIFLVDKKRFAI